MTETATAKNTGDNKTEGTSRAFVYRTSLQAACDTKTRGIE